MIMLPQHYTIRQLTRHSKLSRNARKPTDNNDKNKLITKLIIHKN